MTIPRIRTGLRRSIFALDLLRAGDRPAPSELAFVALINGGPARRRPASGSDIDN
jgi:hypothetical protein